MIPRASHKNLSHYSVAQHIDRKPRRSKAGEDLSRSQSHDNKTAVTSAWLTLRSCLSLKQKSQGLVLSRYPRIWVDSIAPSL